MTTTTQFRWLYRVVLWLWIAAMGFLSLPTFAYDGQGELQAKTKISYDNSRLAAVDYDGAAVLASNERWNQPADTRTSFFNFAALLAAEGGALRFSQTTASPWFSAQGDFAGQTISDVAGQLRAGTMSAADVPVQVVTMDGNTLIVNTRSSLALSQAGIPQSSWNLIDMTGNADVMNSITTRLGNNGLTTGGTSTLRITGSGSGASTYIGAGTIPRP